MSPSRASVRPVLRNLHQRVGGPSVVSRSCWHLNGTLFTARRETGSVHVLIFGVRLLFSSAICSRLQPPQSTAQPSTGL